MGMKRSKKALPEVILPRICVTFRRASLRLRSKNSKNDFGDHRAKNIVNTRPGSHAMIMFVYLTSRMLWDAPLEHNIMLMNGIPKHGFSEMGPNWICISYPDELGSLSSFAHTLHDHTRICMQIYPNYHNGAKVSDCMEGAPLLPLVRVCRTAAEAWRPLSLDHGRVNPHWVGWWPNLVNTFPEGLR